MNHGSPRPLDEFKNFIKKFWPLFILIAAIVAGMKEARRLSSPDSYTYEIKLSAVPKSLLTEAKDALERTVWQVSNQEIKSPASCTPEIFYYNCVIVETLTQSISKTKLDEIRQGTEQVAKKFADKFTFFYKVQDLASSPELEEFLLRHESYDVWVYRNLVKEAEKQGLSDARINTCSFSVGVQACSEYLRQELMARGEKASTSPFLNLISVNQNVLIDSQRFKSETLKPFQLALIEKFSSPSLTHDFPALARSLLFGLSISLLIHSFLYLLLLPKD